MIVRTASIFLKVAFKEAGFLVGSRRDSGFNFFPIKHNKEVVI